jgi:hypothetical protein
MTDSQTPETTSLDKIFLWIRQQNLNKSLITTEHILNSLAPDDFDIIAIQEPYIDFTGNARAKHQWYPIYPRTHYIEEAGHTRSMILVNKKIASTAWTVIDVDSPDVTGILIKTQAINVLIFNLYCDQKHSKAI